jgi:hypothetical protein
MSGKWPAELLESGVCEFHLGLDACRTADAEVACIPCKVTQQSRLPDSGLPPQDQNASLAFPGPLKQAGEPSLFLAPSEQFVAGAITSGGIRAGERGTGDIPATHGRLAPPG